MLKYTAKDRGDIASIIADRLALNCFKKIALIGATSHE